MSNHSSSPMSEELINMFRLGKTNQFPEGKIDPKDEGEIRIAIGKKEGKVIIDLGTDVTWIGFTVDQAEEIAELLKLRATEIKMERLQK